MKSIFILLTIITLATPVLAEQKCWISKCNTYRSATGGNSAIIRWECNENCRCEHFSSSSICALTENDETVCGIGNIDIEARAGAVTDIEFDGSDYPIKEVFVKR